MMEFFKKTKVYLPEGKKYWADYLFHFTEMKNAVSILKTKRLMSRNKALEENKMYSDNASHEVIDQTRLFSLFKYNSMILYEVLESKLIYDFFKSTKLAEINNFFTIIKSNIKYLLFN